MRAKMLISFVVLCIAATFAVAQKRGTKEARPSPNAAVEQTIGTTDVSVTYGRPAVKGRPVWGKLVPFGEVWRIGANEATTITVSKDVLVEGSPSRRRQVGVLLAAPLSPARRGATGGTACAVSPTSSRPCAQFQPQT